MLGVVVIVVGVIGAVKYAQISMLLAYGQRMEEMGPPPEALATAIAKVEPWEVTLSAVGSIVGARSVAVSNDAPGVVTKIHFDSGDVVKRGQLLVELDASTERAQLASAKAQLDLARISAKRTRALVAGGAVARSQQDQDETALETAASQVAALQAEIDRKVVRAPFAGRLGIRAIDLGQYLAPGTTITDLEALDAQYVDFTVPQEHLDRLNVGLPVRVEIQGMKAPLTGKLAAISPAVDNQTRTIQLRATVPQMKGKLRPGMFVRVSIVLPERSTALLVPATAIVHAAYGDSVFVVEPKPPGAPGMRETPDGKPVKIVRQRFVRVGSSRGDFVVIAAGLDAGAEVVTAGAFKLRNGSPIVVDNTRVVEPALAPRPPNR